MTGLSVYRFCANKALQAEVKDESKNSDYSCPCRSLLEPVSGFNSVASIVIRHRSSREQVHISNSLAGRYSAGNRADDNLSGRAFEQAEKLIASRSIACLVTIFRYRL